MAQRVKPVMIGIDVDSRYLQIARHGESQVVRIDNQSTAIEQWLDGLSGPVCVALEATGGYHFDVADRAHARGVVVYVIDPWRLSHYRSGVGQRNKSDPVDARLLARYLAHEHEELRAYRPLSAGHRRAWSLLKRRAKVVRAEGIVTESLRAVDGLKAPVKALKARFEQLKRALERELVKQIQALGLGADYRRAQTLQGVGPLTAAALVLAFHRGEFTRADTFVAYLGLDIRIRRSGRYEGQQKLTKKGEAECRRLLHNAARSAARGDLKAYYTRLRERGLAATQAHVAVARKLVRIAFTLLKNQEDYNPHKLKIA